MKIFGFIITLISLSVTVYAQTTTLPYLANETYTYQAALDEYTKISEEYPEICQLEWYEKSDYGLPIPLFLMGRSGDFSQESLKEKSVILINNGIHPGEPCGVDASIKLIKELTKRSQNLPENVVIAIIPIYNIGGAHNRNCCSRANQNGPKAYGFRGNAKNLDLNRDFIKLDSRNTKAFYALFQRLKPSIFVDTHTSNGADYQHVMTLITSQFNKMNPELAEFTKTKLNPFLYKQMKQQGYPLIPYVHSIAATPDDGLIGFLETPRYSTGYTNLFNCISYVTEAHMLKPYKDRVESTYFMLKNLIEFTAQHHTELENRRKKAELNLLAQSELALNWEHDTTRYDSVLFKGFTAQYLKSQVTGLNRLYYNRELPYEKYIRYYNYYKPIDFVTIPDYYIIPQAWHKVAKALSKSGVKIDTLKNPIQLETEAYYITDYQTVNHPYEGHYLHHSVKVKSTKQTGSYRPGDFIIKTRTPHLRFIVETLEPNAVDSYFAWNYFDAILQQKEWFSSYVFEDEAAEILANNPDIKQAFEEKKAQDSTFAQNAFSQLYFIYKKSPRYEPTHRLYPIVRYFGEIDSTELR